jgi:hypothetical protein
MKTRAIVSQNRKDIVFRPVQFTPSISEEFDICCVGHNFFKIPQPLGEGYVVQDYLLDQTQLTHGGAHMVDPLQLDLTQSSGYAFHLRAACGKRFHVRLPKGVTELGFSAYLGRAG